MYFMVKKIAKTVGLRAFRSWCQSCQPCQPGQSSAHPEADAQVTATAVRWTLQELASLAPGRAVEVRVPPFGAVQVLPGVTHRRGTPPAVIEMDAHTWLRLASGSWSWREALGAGAITASGEHADLSALLPLRV